MDPFFYGENLHIYTARFDLDRQLQTASNTTTNFSFFSMCRQKNVALYCGRCAYTLDRTVRTTIPCALQENLEDRPHNINIFRIESCPSARSGDEKDAQDSLQHISSEVKLRLLKIRSV